MHFLWRLWRAVSIRRRPRDWLCFGELGENRGFELGLAGFESGLIGFAFLCTWMVWLS